MTIESLEQRGQERTIDPIDRVACLYAELRLGSSVETCPC